MSKQMTKTATINGVEYTFQRMQNIRQTMEFRQQWADPALPGGIDDIKMCDIAFEHFVIKPKVKLEDFEDIADAEAVAIEAVSFATTGK